jgi:pilus assembly protein Flp/PilA
MSGGEGNFAARSILGPRGIDASKEATMLMRNNKGATAIEYGLIAALIAVAAISAMGKVGTRLTNTFTNVSGKLVA